MSTRLENLIANKRALGQKIAEVDRVIHEIALSGTASASLSAGVGSKSYTRMDLGTLRTYRAELAQRFSEVNRALLCGSSPAGIRHVMTVRC